MKKIDAFKEKKSFHQLFKQLKIGFHCSLLAVLLILVWSTETLAQTIVLSSGANDGTAQANILTAGNAFGLPAGSSHPDFPFGTWGEAMDQVVCNGQPNQTLQFCASTYSNQTAEGNIDVYQLFPSDIGSPTGGCPANTPASAGSIDGLTIDGQGSYLIVSGTAIGFLDIVGIDNVTVQNFTFQGFNRTGGSVLQVYDAAGFVVNNCVFDSNPTNNPVEIGNNSVTPGTGATIPSATDATFNNCTFSNNPPNGSTQAATNSGAMTIVQNSCGGNTPITVNSNNTDYICNYRDANGGAMVITYGGCTGANEPGATVNIIGGTFSGNIQTLNSNGGGAIYIDGESVLNIDGTTFSCNEAHSSTGESGGGAIYVNDGPAVTIDNAIFFNNTTPNTAGSIPGGGYGGAILWHNNSTGDPGMNISNTMFINNISSRGGALYLDDTNNAGLTCTNCLFEGNSTVGPAGADGGGAIFNDPGNPLNLVNTSVINNTHSDNDAGDAGGIQGPVNLTNSVVCGNTTTGGEENIDGNVTIDAASVVGPGVDGTQGDCNNIPAGVGSTLVNPGNLACEACPTFNTPPSSCEADSGTPVINDCVLLCSTGDDSETGPNPEADPGQAFDLTLNFTPPSCTAPTAFTYVWLVVNSSGVILDVIAATDADANGIPDAAEGTPQSFDFANLPNAGALPPGTYTIHGYHYLTADAGAAAPAIGTNISALDAMATGTNTAFCDDLGEPSPDITVLNPVLINITTTCTGAAAGEFNTTLTITGGYPEFNGSGTYAFTTNTAGLTSPYTFGTPQTTGVTYVATSNIDVTVTSDGNMVADVNCTNCNSMLVQEPHLLCILCPDITDGSLAVQGAPAPTAVCDGDMVQVCVDVDLTNDATAVVEFSNDGGTTWTDGTPNAAVPPTQFCATFTETNTTCNATTANYQTRFRANSLVNPLCDVDLQTTGSGGAAVSVDVFADLNDLVASGDITLNGNNTCGPSISQNCAFTVTNDFDGNGANPDFTSTVVNGTVNFTITQTGAPAGCASLVIPANYACLPFNPSIMIDKDDSTPTPGDAADTDGDDTQTIATGTTATFTITITNDGTEPMCNVSVADANSAGCAMTVADLLPLIMAQGNNDNILDPAESISYICTQANVTADFTNTAIVNAQDCNTNNPETDMDDTEVIVVNPSIMVDKDDSTPTAGDPADTDGDDSQTIVTNGTATFTITVTNNGTEDLCNLSITDANSADCAMTVAEAATLVMGQGNGDAILNIGESVTFTCTETNVAASFTNTAVVNAEGCTTGTAVTDNDPTDVVVVNPSIMVDKDDSTPTAGDPADTDGDDSQTIVTNGTATFTITVTNNGTEDLCNLSITDANSADCAMTVAEAATLVMGQGNGDAILNVGESVTFTCTETNVAASFTNTAVVNAEGCTTGTAVTDNDPTDVVVVNPSIMVDKDDSTPTAGDPADTDGDDSQTIVTNGTATFTITVTNNGTEDLCNLSISDVNSSDCAMTVAEAATLVMGQGNGDAILNVGESVTFTCTETNVAASFTNTAVVNAEGCTTGTTVTDMDDSEVIVVAPSIMVDKDDSTPTAGDPLDTDGDDSQTIVTNGTATFTITVTNNGTEDLCNLSITDANSADCAMTVAEAAILVMAQGNGDAILNIGESITFVCTEMNVAASFTNTVVVDAEGCTTGTAVTDNDPTQVVVVAPSIMVDKDDSTPTAGDPADTDGDDSQITAVNGTSTFTITVTNDGTEDMCNITVTDANSSDCDMTVAETEAAIMAVGNLDNILNPGESFTYTCTETNVTAGFTNTAIVNAEGCITGTSVNDMDDTEVLVPLLLADKTSTFVDGNGDGNLNPGEQVDYTIVLTNTGNGDALDVMFSDMIPVGTAYVAGSLATTQGTVDESGDPLTADLGTVAANGGTVTITFSVTIDNPFTNIPLQVENQGVFTSTNHPDTPTDDPTVPTNDPDNPGDPGDPTIDPVVFPILLADKTSTFVDANGDNLLNPGEQVDYTIVLENTGNGDALNVLFSDMIPVGTSYVGGTLMTSQGTVDDSGDPLTGNLGTVPANGGTVTITFSVTVDNPFTNAPPTIENQGVFTSTNHPDVPTDDPTVPTNDPENPGDPGDPTIDPVAEPMLFADKTSTYVDANNNNELNPTEQVDYTIVLINTGGGDAFNVTFSDAIPVGTTYVPGTLMTTQGTVDDSGDPLTAVIGTVPASGGTVTITFSVTVNNPFTNDPAIIENQGVFNSTNHPDVPTDDPTVPTNDPMNPGDPGDPTIDPVGPNIIVLNDPCNCLDNESEDGDDGQFTEIITLLGPANQTWIIQSVDGLFSTTSPAPPAAPMPFPANFQLTETVPGTYILEGIHVDAVGFTITLTDGVNTITVPDVGRNTCFYPEGALLGLSPSYCSDDMSTVAVNANLTGNPAGTIVNFEIVGETAFTAAGNTLTFVPSDLAAGTYTVRYEFDAEDATVNDPTDPGCMILLEETFIIDEPLMILCRPPVNIDAEANCEVANPGILPPVVIGGGVGDLVVSNDAPAFFQMGTTTVNWTITDGNGCAATCTQTVTVHDNEPPTIDCGNAFYANTSWTNCGYPSTLLEGPTVSDNCGIASITNDAPAFFPPGMYMPTWTVTDVNGNTASCMQWVTVNDTTKPKFTSCPEDIEVEAVTADGAPATWAQPQAMDNCPGDIIFVSTHDSGDFFPLGTTQVTYTAYDQNGQSMDCSFTVTVTPIGVPLVAIAGLMATESDEAVQDVEVHINGEMTDMFMTADDGLYNFNVPFNGDYSIAPEKDINYLNGVSTFDLVLISKHILGDQLLDSPYKMIAADANKSNFISTLDLVQIQKLILLVDDEFSNNTSWRFINKAYVFPNPANPFGADFPEVINFNNITQADLNADFVAVKIGDVNGNASANNLLGADDRTGETALKLTAKNVEMKAGETYEITMNAADFNHLGFQFTLDFAADKVDFNSIESDLAKADNFGLTLLEEGAITVSWFDAQARQLATEDAVIRLTLTAKVDATLAEVLSINSKFTTAEAYANNGDLQTVELNFDNAVSTNFKLYQNVPNPFSNETFIGFDLPNASAATLTITDVSGKVVYRTTGNFAKGHNRIELTKNDLPTNGVWYYQLKTATDFASGKMVLIK